MSDDTPLDKQLADALSEAWSSDSSMTSDAIQHLYNENSHPTVEQALGAIFSLVGKIEKKLRDGNSPLD